MRVIDIRKKVIIIILFVFFILGGLLAWDYFSHDNSVVDRVMSLFVQTDEDIYTKSNNSAFQAMEVNGKLKPVEIDTSDSISIPVYYGTNIVNVPLPNNNYITNYSDTIFAKDGSVYCVISKSKDNSSVSERQVDIKDLGKNSPFVFEYKFPNSDGVLYIQCYSGEALYFYQNLSIDDILFTNDVLIGKYSDEIASNVSIPKAMYEKEYLPTDVSYIVQNFILGSESGFDSYNSYNGYDFSYCRVVGVRDEIVKSEYYKMKTLGYIPEYVAYGDNCQFISFDKMYVVVKNITSNSCIIYHITK